MSVLINKFMENTLDPSRQTLAVPIGNPSTKEQAGSKNSSDDELGLRSDYLYAHVFPGHSSCIEQLGGHTLPKMSALVLEKLAKHRDLSSFNIKEAVCKWFQYIDTDLNGTIEKSELLSEFVQMGLPFPRIVLPLGIRSSSIMS